MNDAPKVVVSVAANPTNWKELRGKKPGCVEGDMILYVKFVALTPTTLEGNPDLAKHVDAQPGYIFSGNAEAIKKIFDEGFDEISAQYAKALKGE